MYLWEIKSFGEFQLKEFHDLIALRISVFVIEQNCPYQELDGNDQNSTHIVCKKDDKIIATARIVAPGISYDEPSIGRVVIAEEERGLGLGHQLMIKTLKAAEEIYGKVPVRMSAQEHLIGYYNTHGFKVVSEVYLEDDIPHVQMLYTP